MSNSWVGIRVKKEGREGTIVHDSNHILRILTVRFDDEKDVQSIIMSNVGDDPNPEELSKWFWWCENGALEDKWYQF